MSLFRRLKIYHYGIFLLYLALSWKLGEVQPFTRAPMYESFPNWSYAFYLENENGEPLFTAKYFTPSRNPGAMGSMFYDYCNAHGYHLGYGEEDKDELHEVGDFMLGRWLEGSSGGAIPGDSVYLVRKHIFFNKRAELIEENEIIAGRKF